LQQAKETENNINNELGNNVMKILNFRLIILILVCSVQLTAQNKVNRELTIYSNDYGVMLDTREYKLEKGLNNLTFSGVPPTIIQTSVFPIFDGQIIEQSYRYDIENQEMLFNKIKNKKISIINSKNEKFTGEFISVNKAFIFKTENDSIFILPDINDYTIITNNVLSDLILVPTILWKLNSEKSGIQNIAVNYIFREISWNADYNAIIQENDKIIDLDAMFTLVNNTGYTIDDVKVNLVSGKINLEVDYLFRGVYKTEDRQYKNSNDLTNYNNDKVSDYSIFSLKDRINIEDNESKQITMFNKKNIKVKRTKRFNSYLRMIDGRFDNYVKIKNDTASGLGLLLPQGKIRFYKSLNNKPEFIGESTVELTNPNEELEFKLGEVPGIKFEQIITNESNKPGITITDYEVKINNRTDKDEEIEVIFNIEDKFNKIIKSSFKYEKLNFYQCKYITKIKKGSEITLNYSVETVVK
jgi:hypothetical protein